MLQYVMDSKPFDIIRYGIDTLSNATFHYELNDVWIIPEPDYNGAIDSIVIWVKDMDHDQRVYLRPFNLTIMPVNDAPVFTGNVPNYTIPEDSLVRIPANSFFTDVDNDTLYFMIRNVVNASQTIEDSMITVVPTQGWNGTITGLILEAYDLGPTPAQSNEFEIEVTPPPPPPMRSVCFMFKAVYGDTVLTSGTSTLTYRKMLPDTSGYVWAEDSVKTSDNGIITLDLLQGVYDVNGLHTESVDVPNIKYTFLKRPGELGLLEQRARDDHQSPVMFNTAQDTVLVYKLMNDFPLIWALEYASKLDGINIGTRRFGNNDLNAPAWWNANYLPSDSSRRAWTYELIAELQTIPHVNLNLQYQEGTETPNVPGLGIAVDSSFPSPGSNCTGYNHETHEITNGSAQYPPWPTKYTFRIEILQAINDLNDWAGSDPAILNGSSQGNTINDRGRRIFSFLYLANPKTKL